MKPAALLLAAAVAAPCAAAEKEAPLLNAGDPAPALSVAHWVKGTPVKGFEKGKLYVIEFWATWCGPCRRIIPHMSELARKHEGKIVFVGVSTYENRGDDDAEVLAKVKKFVEGMGDKMAYNVAYDGQKNATGKAWLEAALEGGIPTAFVVGGDGKILWIGHPAEIDKVLDEALAGTFDVQKFAAARLAAKDEERKARAAQEKQQKLFRPIAELVVAGKAKEALAELDKVTAENKELEKPTRFLRFRLLLAADEPKAYRLAREIATGAGEDDGRLVYAVAQTLLEPNALLRLKGSEKLAEPDHDTTIAVATRATELMSDFPRATAALAEAHFRKGDAARAVEVQQRALKQLDKLPGSPAAERKALEDKLETYRKAARDR